jgi:hypothetical protein
MSKEAMTLALEALETYHGYMEPLTTVFGGPRVPAEQSTTGKVERGIKFLRQAITEALAKQEQGEPVAEVILWRGEKIIQWEQSLPVGTKFYTTPQPAQKPLSEAAIEGLAKFVAIDDFNYDFARAIEKAHGIKENT